MSRSIEAVIYREDDQWVAQALNVDVSSFGDTLRRRGRRCKRRWNSILRMRLIVRRQKSQTGNLSNCMSKVYSSREVLAALRKAGF